MALRLPIGCYLNHYVLWLLILSRTMMLVNELFNELLEKLKKQGYDVPIWIN
jgi:hypothetical protein